MRPGHGPASPRRALREPLGYDASALSRDINKTEKHMETITPTIGLEEAAALLRCHPETARRMAKAGEIPGAKIGRSWVFYRERLLEWIEARCQSGLTKGQTKEDPMIGVNPLASRLAAKLAAARDERIKRRG